MKEYFVILSLVASDATGAQVTIHSVHEQRSVADAALAALAAGNPIFPREPHDADSLVSSASIGVSIVLANVWAELHQYPAPALQP